MLFISPVRKGVWKCIKCAPLRVHKSTTTTTTGAGTSVQQISIRYHTKVGTRQSPNISGFGQRQMFNYFLNGNSHRAHDNVVFREKQKTPSQKKKSQSLHIEKNYYFT